MGACPVVSDSLQPHGLKPEACLKPPLSMGLSRQEYCSGLSFPPPEDLPRPGMEPKSPALAAGFFTTEPPGKLISATSSLDWHPSYARTRLTFKCRNIMGCTDQGGGDLGGICIIPLPAVMRKKKIRSSPKDITLTRLRKVFCLRLRQCQFNFKGHLSFSLHPKDLIKLQRPLMRDFAGDWEMMSVD